MVELGEIPGTDAHQAAVVEAHHQRLGSFRDQLACHQPSSPRRGAPVDGSQRIVGERFAHALELAALGAKPHGAQADFRKLAATRERFVDIDRREVRIHANLALPIDGGLPPPKSPRAGDPHNRRTNCDVTTCDRRHGVLDRGGKMELPARL